MRRRASPTTWVHADLPHQVRVSATAMLWAALGPAPSQGGRDEWQAWNEQYGWHWRCSHEMPLTASDRERLKRGDLPDTGAPDPPCWPPA